MLILISSLYLSNHYLTFTLISSSSARKGHVFNYAVSVPYRKVRANEEVLLAYEMNGKKLPKIHGGPLRVVVTGFIGARSCKWVYKINALAEPSLGPVQSQEYLYYNQQVCVITCVNFPTLKADSRSSQMGKQNVKYSNGFSIQAMPVSCVVFLSCYHDLG